MSYREFEKSTIIVGENARKQWGIHQQLKKEAIKFDERIEQQKKTWVFIPPSAMAIELYQDLGELASGLLLCVPQAVGRTLIRRKQCAIIERDYIAVDAVLEGDHEQVLAVFGIGQYLAEAGI